LFIFVILTTRTGKATANTEQYNTNTMKEFLDSASQAGRAIPKLTAIIISK